MQISVASGYAINFIKGYVWNGRRWKWKIIDWEYVPVVRYVPTPPKKSVGKFCLFEFKKSRRGDKDIIVGAYYGRREGNEIVVVYCECVP